MLVCGRYLSSFRWFSPFDLNDYAAFPFGGLVARTGRTGGEFVYGRCFSFFLSFGGLVARTGRPSGELFVCGRYSSLISVVVA